MTDLKSKLIERFGDALAPVGSRATCDPAPVGTDTDFLLKTGFFGSEERELMALGFHCEGDSGKYSGRHSSPFRSFRCRYGDENLNVIVTSSGSFFDRFMAATSVAKRLNLLDKADRIALFRAVLYSEVSE